MAKRNKQEQMASITEPQIPYEKPSRSNFRVIGLFAFLAITTVGIFAGNGWLPNTDQMTGKKTGWFGKELPKDSTSIWNPFAPPPPSPTPQLSKEYIYAGSRLLAVEDANASAAPPADLAVWRPSTGVWYVLGGAGSQQTTYYWGQSGDRPAQGDFDGDGKTDFCVFRAEDSYWYILQSSTNSVVYINFGLETDILAPADFDGDGKTDAAVFRASVGTWYVHQSTTQTMATYAIGQSGDKPSPGDYDGDGRADAAVWRYGTTSQFHARRSTDGQILTVNLGSNSTDEPVSADYDGDGKANFALLQGANWLIMNAALSGTTTTAWQQAGDVAVQNDYDGDGIVDIAVWRNQTRATWYIRQSSNLQTRIYSSASSDNVYRTSITAPDGTKTDNYMYRGLKPGCDYSDPEEWVYEYGGLRWGYDNALTGRTFETRVFSSTNQILQRTVSRWAVKTTMLFIGGLGGPNYLARNARAASTESLTYDSNAGLSSVTKFLYDLPDDVGSPLNLKNKLEYAYTSVTGGSNFSPGQAPSLVTPPTGEPTTGALLKNTETTYKLNTEYVSQNLRRLPEIIKIKNGSGVEVSQSEIVYDEQDRSPGFRGNPTTIKVWDSTKGLVTNPIAYVSARSKFDTYGNQYESTDALGNTTTTVFDALQTFPVSVTSPAPGNGTYGSSTGFTTLTNYDPETGLLLSTTDPNNHTTTTEYNDPLLRPTRVLAPNGHQTITEYGAGTDASSRWVKIRTQVDASSWREAKSFYDGLGRTVLTQSIDASTGDVFIETQYDSAGRQKRVSNPYRNGDAIYWKENTFDTAGRLWKVITLTDGATVETTYGVVNTGSHIGTVVTMKDQALKERRSVTNALGQLIRVDEPTGNGLGALDAPNQDTRYLYDTLSNLITVEQGVQTRTFVYNSLSKLTSATNPELGTTPTNGIVQYIYDNNGNLTQKTDPRGVVTAYVYDALNRVTNQNYSAPNPTPANYQASPNVNYYYDNLPNAKGKLIKTTSSVSTTEFTSFNLSGRVTAHKQTTDGVEYPTAYTYSLAGALINETYPSGRVVKNVRDTNGDLSAVSSKESLSADFWNYASDFTYSSAGSITNLQLGNGNWESTIFNARLQPTQIALGSTPGTTDKLKLNYGYGAGSNNGNILSQDITVIRSGQSPLVFNQTYTYDALNRLLSAEEKTGGVTNWKQTYIFDRYGNRNFGTGTNQPTVLNNVTNPTFEAARNRYSAGQNYSYDMAGNVTADANGQSYFYDGENKQVVASTGGGLIAQYWFDGDGRRVKKFVQASGETTVFIYDASGKLIAENSTNVVPAQNAKIQYITEDILGTPRINTDREGNVISRTDYMPYGEEIIGLGNRVPADKYVADDVRQGFTGYENDGETGLNFAQARNQKANHGRFNSPDPLAASAKRMLPQSWNRYVYVLNNPLNLVDPSGLIWGSRTEDNTTYFCYAPGKAVCKGYTALPDNFIVLDARINGKSVGDIVLNSNGTWERVVAVSGGQKGGKTFLREKDWDALIDATGGAICSLSVGFVCPEAKLTDTNISGNVKAAMDGIQMAFLIKTLVGAGVSLAVAAAIVKKNPDQVAKMAAEVIRKGYKNGECLQCAQDLLKEFEKSGIAGEIVELATPNGERLMQAANYKQEISDLGRHYGVKVGDLVYEMYSSKGIPIKEWAKRYEYAPGFGPKVANPVLVTVTTPK